MGEEMRTLVLTTLFSCQAVDHKVTKLGIQIYLRKFKDAFHYYEMYLITTLRTFMLAV